MEDTAGPAAAAYAKISLLVMKNVRMKCLGVRGTSRDHGQCVEGRERSKASNASC